MPGGLAPDIDGQNQAIAVPLFTGGLIKDARHRHDPEPCDGLTRLGRCREPSKSVATAQTGQICAGRPDQGISPRAASVQRTAVFVGSRIAQAAAAEMMAPHRRRCAVRLPADLDMASAPASRNFARLH